MIRITGENIIFNNNGIKISYDDIGPVGAPPVVFIHGFPLNKSMWELQAEMLKSNFRVISYDVRGYGESTGGDGAFTLEDLSNDLIALMDHLSLRKVVVCGQSLGGYVVLNSLQKYSDRFHAAVLCSVQCNSQSRFISDERLKMADRIGTYGLENYADEMTRQLFCRRSFVTRKEEVRAVRNMILKADPKTIYTTLNALSERRDMCSFLPEISIPVLIVSGHEDIVTPPAASEFLHFSIPGSERLLVEYSGHMANLENTHDFNQGLKRFIEAVCRHEQLSPHCVENR
jgi:3-oxoadipate enol-lactonase